MEELEGIQRDVKPDVKVMVTSRDRGRGVGNGVGIEGEDKVRYVRGDFDIGAQVKIHDRSDKPGVKRKTTWYPLRRGSSSRKSIATKTCNLLVLQVLLIACTHLKALQSYCICRDGYTMRGKCLSRR